MITSRLAALAAAPILILAWTLPVRADTAAPAAAPTTCKDGTTSTATGRGACSGHGGVQKGTGSAPTAATVPTTPSTTSPTAKPAASGAAPAAGSSTAAKSTGNTDPTGATAKCKDGTYSKSKSHSGACSHHGGVDQWLGAS